MNYDIFIPKDIQELYDKLKSEDLQGKLSKEDDLLRWKLPNHIIVEIAMNHIQCKGKPPIIEGYIGTHYLNDGRVQDLTHWPPTVNEIYQDLMDINNGKTIWIKKKTIWGEQILIMDREEYEALSKGKKEKCTILS